MINTFKLNEKGSYRYENDFAIVIFHKDKDNEKNINDITVSEITSQRNNYQGYVDKKGTGKKGYFAKMDSAVVTMDEKFNEKTTFNDVLSILSTENIVINTYLTDY